jgi:hypothetical protein
MSFAQGTARAAEGSGRNVWPMICNSSGDKGRNRKQKPTALPIPFGCIIFIQVKDISDIARV